MRTETVAYGQVCLPVSSQFVSLLAVLACNHDQKNTIREMRE